MSGVNWGLRIEGLALFVASIAAYIHLRGDGLLFAVLLLAPDLAMLGYLVNTRIGALVYNVAHHYAVPLVLIGAGLATGTEALLLIGLIWSTHISMDRTVGYGFKYPSAFKDTHLQRV